MRLNSTKRLPRSRIRLMAVAVLSCYASVPAWAQQTVTAADLQKTAIGNFNAVQGNRQVDVYNLANRTVATSANFHVLAGETFNIHQNSASDAFMVRVTGQSGQLQQSVIAGKIWSNGQFWLQNAAGTIIKPGAVIDVSRFVATLGITDANFLAGKLTFDNPANGGKIVNQGTIKTASGGSVYLVGTDVANEGVIQTPQGEAILAAGEKVELIDTGTPGVKVQITGQAGNVTNLGQILADAGRIGMVGAVVKNSGLLNVSASNVVSDGGRVFLKASQDTYVDGKGRIVATGRKGGKVEVLGNRVAVMDEAEIDASGTHGGGTILVGGDYQGKNPDVQNAQITYFGPDAKLKADATDNGDGGKIVLWADDTTRAFGSISARGGDNGGNGGFVETSGKNYLDVKGIRGVVTSAPKGKAGTWLLDPTDITITHGASAAAPFTGGVFNNGGGATSTLTDGDINSQLGGTSVTISTSGSGGGNGDIVFQDDSVAISFNGSTGGTALTLTADRNIELRGTVTNNSTVGSARTLVLQAGNKVLTSSGATFNLTGANSTEQMTVQVANGKTWENYGTVNLSQNARVDLSSGATFHNKTGANFNSTNTNNSATIFVGSAGAIVNDGTLYVSTTLTDKVFASQLNSSGSFKTDGGRNLFLDGGASFSGNVDLHPVATTGTLVVRNGTTTSFENVSFSDSGNIYIGYAGSAGTSYFKGSNTGRANVILGGTGTGTAYVQNGSTVLGNLQVGSAGTLNLNNATLGVNGNNISTATGAFNFSGNVGLVSTGTLTVDKAINTAGTVLLASGWDGTSSVAAPTTSGAGGVTLTGAAVQASAATIKAGTAGLTTSGTASVATAGDVTIAAGAVTLGSSSSVIKSTSGNVSITTTATGIALNDGQVEATGHAVTLDSATSISQTANSVVKASTLTATARAGSVGLGAGNNLVSTLNASATTTVAFKSALDLTIGSLSGTGYNILSAGKLGWNYAGGNLTLRGVDTFRANGKLSIASSAGNLDYNGATLGGNGGSVDVILAASGNLSVNNALSNADGGVALAAGNTLGIGASVTGQGIALAGKTVDVSAEVRDNAATSADGGIEIVAGDFTASGAGSLTSNQGSIVGAIAGNLSLSYGAYFEAGTDITLGFAGANSTLSLTGDATYPSYLLAGSPNTINLVFAGRSTGGIMIDGVATTTSQAGGSGLFVVSRSDPAVAGAGLNLRYGLGSAAAPATLSDTINAINNVSGIVPGTQSGTLTPSAPGSNDNGARLDDGSPNGDKKFGDDDKASDSGNPPSEGDNKPKRPIGRCSA